MKAAGPVSSSAWSVAWAPGWTGRGVLADSSKTPPEGARKTDSAVHGTVPEPVKVTVAANDVSGLTYPGPTSVTFVQHEVKVQETVFTSLWPAVEAVGDRENPRIHRKIRSSTTTTEIAATAIWTPWADLMSQGPEGVTPKGVRCVEGKNTNGPV